LWGFIAPESYSGLTRLHDNSPLLLFPTTTPGIVPAPVLKDYFVDGPTGLYQLIDGTGATTTAYIYLAMRRGGRLMYALDVSNPSSPQFLWKHSNTDVGFTEMGQTWSQPKVSMVEGYANPVLIFGGGYDPSEDSEAPLADTMGRGIFILDATTGALLWSATPNVSPGCTATKCELQVTGMNYSIPSDITLLDHDKDGKIDRLYVGDVGGNVWRVDLEPAGGGTITGNTPDFWKVEKLAALGCNTGTCAAANPAGPVPRKFFYPPEVITVAAYDAVFIGSGDREHPLYTDPASTLTSPLPFPGSPPYSVSAYNVTNRLYMLEDTVTGGNGSGLTTITESTLFDSTATAYNGTLSGYYITLTTGEKAVNAPLAVAGYVYFGTNKPKPPQAQTSTNQCEESLGEAASYQLSPFSGTFTKGEWETGGLPPSPVAGVVSVRDSVTGQMMQVPFCIGCGVGEGSGGGQSSTCDASASAACRPKLDVSTSRSRAYWYMDAD
jgi:type IV pilus assembly protein PilY1